MRDVVFVYLGADNADQGHGINQVYQKPIFHAKNKGSETQVTRKEW